LFFFSARKSLETKRLKYRLTVVHTPTTASERGGRDCFYRGRERVFVSARAVC